MPSLVLIRSTSLKIALVYVYQPCLQRIDTLQAIIQCLHIGRYLSLLLHTFLTDYIILCLDTYSFELHLLQISEAASCMK